MSRPRRDDADTPADHWKNRIVQKTTRLPSREDFRTKPGSSARSRRHWSLIVRYFAVAAFFGAAGTVAYMAWDGFAEDPAVSETAADIDFKTNGDIPKKWVLDRLTDGGKRPLPPIFDIKRNLEAEPQIREVTVRRLAGGSLAVEIFERRAVMRMVGLLNGAEVTRFIASDGVSYEGVNIGQMTSGNLPLLLDAKGHFIKENGFDRFVGFEPIAAFLDLAREKYPAVYRDWRSVSVREYPGRPDAPGAVILVKPHLGTQSPDSAAIVEIVFSPLASYYAEELDWLANPAVSEAVRQKLRTVDRAKFPQYRLDLSLVNQSNPRYPVPELRIIPVLVAPRQP